MKIAFVYDAVYPWVKGGAEKRIYEIGKRLVERGHEVHLFGMKWWEGEDIIELEGMILHGVCKSGKLYTNGRRSIIQALIFSISLFRPLLKEKFDIIDVSVFPYFSCFTGKAVSVIKRTPLVFTWHEVWDDYWYEYLGKIGFFGLLIERIVSKLSENNIAVSGWTKRKMESIGIKTENSYTVPNGIDLEQIHKIKSPDDKSDIVFAGRLIKEKNVDLLLKAIYLVKYSKPDVNCIIMGDGPEKENLRKLTDKLELTNNVLFMGFMQYEDLIRNIKGSKVMALPSRREGFGIIAIEGFACGKPVVTTNSKNNATQEIVTDSINGFVVEGEEEFARVIEKVLDDNILYSKLAENSESEAQKYNWESIYITCISIYEQI
ncbi:glycosyltransferase family 4 protein [Methanolobus sp. ZRKC2]|uniref:glycosyltransferase family 4 protein n=1 Tax=Methanolobus sp. ZRKC2 TaxID=3125783 RepID=UPI003245F93E